MVKKQPNTKLKPFGRDCGVKVGGGEEHGAVQMVRR